MSRLPLVVAACALVWSGCAEDAQGLEWSIDFADDSLRTQVYAVEAFIVRGGCDTPDPAGALWTETIRPAETMGAQPPLLPPGTYGFAARARDLGCRWHAAGCAEATLGGPDSPAMVRTILEASAAAVVICSAADCSAGLCATEDAGPPDAGPTDAGTMVDADGRDAGVPTDASVDAATPMDTGPPPTDAGPSDAGPPDSGPTPRSCDDIYGMANMYRPCAMRATECEFYTYLGNTLNCDDVCTSFGGTCIRTYRENEPAECTYMFPDPRPCGDVHEDEICVCSRPP